MIFGRATPTVGLKYIGVLAELLPHLLPSPPKKNVVLCNICAGFPLRPDFSACAQWSAREFVTYLNPLKSR